MKETSLLNNQTLKDQLPPTTALSKPLRIEPYLWAELNVAKFSPFIFPPAHSKTDVPRIKTWVSEDPDTGMKRISRILIEPVDHHTTVTLDHRVFLVLQHFWWEKLREIDGTVAFTFHELARALSMTWGRRVRLLLKASLHRLRKVPITWDCAFYDAAQKRLGSLEEPINLLSTLRIYELDTSTDRPPMTKSVFRFNKYVEASLNKHYTKPLVFGVMRDLRGEIALSLYAHLDLVMSNKTVWERRLTELLRDDLCCTGISKYPADRRRLLERAREELNHKPISTGTLNLIITKTNDGKDYKLVVRKIGWTRRLTRPTPDPETMSLVDEILSFTGPNDQHSRPFYAKIVRELGRHQVYAILSETRQADREGRIETKASNPRARYLTDLAQRYRGRKPLGWSAAASAPRGGAFGRSRPPHFGSPAA